MNPATLLLVSISHHATNDAACLDTGKNIEILESAVSPKGRLKLGSLLADIGRQTKLNDKEFAVFEQAHGRGRTSVSRSAFSA